MEMIDEEKLLEELRNPQTSRKGFARLVSEYSERLYWQIRKMVLSHDDANDILQDVFIKAWTNLEISGERPNLLPGFIALPSMRASPSCTKSEARITFPSMMTTHF